MKPFNLEAAKAGDPIVTRDGHERFFVGVSKDGYVVAESSNPSSLRLYTHDLLFMATKKRTVWMNLYPNRGSIAYYYDSEEEADHFANNRTRIGGKAYPVEIEE